MWQKEWWGNYSNQPFSKILETREFSCPGMTGFTFKYPVFRGWEVKDVTKPSSNQDRCIVWLNWPNTIRLDDTPRIVVLIEPIPGIPDKNGIVQDKAKVYSDAARKSFNAKTFFVNIDISSIPDKNGFSHDQFWKTVIESFQVFYVAR